MSVLEQISNPYLASLALGLLYGLTFCTSVCLPYVASYIAGIKAGFRRGVTVTAIYNSGRIAAYAVIGSLAGLFKFFVSGTFLESYQQFSSIIFGFVVIFIGISIFFKKTSGDTCMVKDLEPQGILKSVKQRFDVRAFSMGFTRGFVLCPPLIALLLYAVTFSQANCTLLAVLFGLGTALSPLLFLGGVVGWLLEKAPDFRKWISILGGIILVLLGISVLSFAVIELLQL
ncbi:MAG: sulfite exporter TauE/SafE family protein [Candidatus Bathyarchaeum sp.]|nr:MAG: sulfite exporter TauE/SafE family protein [Candidatus Bathyarchaeum sp.]